MPQVQLTDPNGVPVGTPDNPLSVQGAAIPSGTNTIGKVDQGLQGSAVSPWYVRLMDGASSAVGVALDVSAQTLITRANTIVTLLAGGFPTALGTSGGVKVDGSGTALPVSAAALPLPAGAATDRTTAAAPAAVRISADGTNFVDSTHPVRTDPTGTTTQPMSSTQLPIVLGTAGGLKVSVVDAGSSSAAPTAATAMLKANFTVGITQGVLSGSFPRGATLKNLSTGGQSIGLGPTGVTMANAGIVLAPGDSWGEPALQNLAIVFAISDIAGADLRAGGLS